MKKQAIFMSAAAVAVATLAFFPAAETKAAPKGMAGCGVGQFVIQENNIMQIFAATTNGTVTNQSLGITFGTIGCTPGGAAYIEHQQEVFVAVNFENLEKEMAAGKGESVDAFSNLLGCKSSSAFGAMSRENYDSFFGAQASPTSLLTAVKNKIGQSCDI